MKQSEEITAGVIKQSEGGGAKMKTLTLEQLLKLRPCYTKKQAQADILIKLLEEV